MTAKNTLLDFLADHYSPQSLLDLELFFRSHATLHIPQLPNGVFAAVSGMSHASVTGYQDFWLRDNAMIAGSFMLRGDFKTALSTMTGLTPFLRQQESRFQQIIRNPSQKDDIQERPHVRFSPLGESRSWSHAQNDALGYVLWLRFALANAGKMDVDTPEYGFYRLFPLYFQAIDYSNDLDSGAWEEDRKLNSSSIGAVMASLRQMHTWLRVHVTDAHICDCVDTLIQQGSAQLRNHLPYESPPKRNADAATLLLIHPAEVLNPQDQDAVLQLVERDLVREIGVIRYVGDSYYGQDYPDWFREDQLAGDFSARIALRNAKLRPGFEAQWCLFDSLLSLIYAKKFLSLHDDQSLKKQIDFFNRSLKQLTPGVQCPELYFCRHGAWVPNPHTPLGWAQANLALALDYMKRSAQLVAGTGR
jgi:Glycosyl hydrolases family 15